jgi:hypothetical protein
MPKKTVADFPYPVTLWNLFYFRGLSFGVVPKQWSFVDGKRVQ